MPSFNPSVPYFSERLQMRPPVMADLERFYAIFGDPQTQRFNPAGPLTSEAQAASALQERLAGWRQHGYGSWALALRERPDWVIGFGGLSWKPLGAQRTVNLGYRFDTCVWGMGLATEMARASLQYGFVGLGLGEISAIVRAENQASWRVLEKIGMQRVDTLDDVPGAAPSLVYTLKRGDYQG
ncbi:GNAT family N-acetyltransferase [Serratia marcescens]